MKRIVLWLSTTSAALVLLVGYHTSTAGPGVGRVRTGLAPAGVVVAGSAATSGATSRGATAVTPAPIVGTRATKAPTASIVVNGTVASNPYGQVQVQIAVTGGHITRVTTLAYPTDGQSGDINRSAVPSLEQAAVAAQGAGIDTVSGATYTSDSFRTSLQAALDAAHL